MVDGNIIFTEGGKKIHNGPGFEVGLLGVCVKDKVAVAVDDKIV
jgi:hypothetical protein